MALAVRSSVSCKAGVRPTRASRSAVKPVAALNHKAAAGVAAVAVAAVVAAAPVEAANVVSTVASAAEGYPFVPPAWAPALFVPLTGLVFPAIGMAWAFTYISKEK